MDADATRSSESFRTLGERLVRETFPDKGAADVARYLDRAMARVRQAADSSTVSGDANPGGALPGSAEFGRIVGCERDAHARLRVNRTGGSRFDADGPRRPDEGGDLVGSAAGTRVDTFTFHNVTTNGPAAFGTGATAISGAPSAQWLAELQHILGDFHRQWPQSQQHAEPAQVERVEEALASVTEQLERQSVDRAVLKDRLTRFSVVVATVAGLAGIADRIRDWVN
jgi:hypothetical protein